MGFYDELTPEQFEAYQTQQQNVQIAQQQQAGADAARFAEEEAHIANSREFYLKNDDILDNFYCYLTGRVEKGDARDDTIALMNDSAAKFLIAELVTSIDKIVALSSFEEKDIKNHVFQIREIVAGWLVLEGWLKHKINPSYFRAIRHQVELIAFSSLMRAKKGRWQNFMNTSVRSIENVSHVMGSTPPQNLRGAGSRGGGRRSLLDRVKPW